MTEMAREPQRITAEELKNLIDMGEPVTILDVRSARSYDNSSIKIRGAIRIPPGEIRERMNDIPTDKDIITYCA